MIISRIGLVIFFDIILVCARSPPLIQGLAMSGLSRVIYSTQSLTLISELDIAIDMIKSRCFKLP